MPRVSLNVLAPDFTLPDLHGDPVRLSDFRGRSNVLLVFNRTFVWPFCRRHMAQLRQDHSKFVDRNVEIIVVGPENTAAFVKYWQAESLPFVGLPDPTHSVLKLYGQEVKLFKLGRMPAQVLVDKAGNVRFVHYGNGMSDIPENEEILALADELNGQVAASLP